MICKLVLLQQLMGEENQNPGPVSCFPATRPRMQQMYKSAQVISRNPQEKPPGSGDCFCGLKREGIKSLRREGWPLGGGQGRA